MTTSSSAPKQQLQQKIELMDQESLKKEVIRVKGSTVISFDDYLKFFLGLNTKEEYKTFIQQMNKQKLHDFPDLFQAKLDKDKQVDIGGKIEPLASTNTMYMNIFKFIQTNLYKQKLYTNTIYDKYLVEEEEPQKKDNDNKEIEKIFKEFLSAAEKTGKNNDDNE